MLPKKLILAFSRYTYSRERDLVISARSDNFVQQGYFFQKPVELNRSEVIELFERGTIYNAFRPHAMKLFGGFVTKPKKLSPLYKGFHLDGANQDGIAFYQDYDYESALEAFTKSAEQGDSWGQLNLAQMYLAGEGTEKNIERAVFWLKKSLSQNNQKALELCKTLSECKLEN